MSWPHHTGERHQPDWVVYVRDSEKFRLTNVIPERIIFVSRGITVFNPSSSRFFPWLVPSSAVCHSASRQGISLWLSCEFVIYSYRCMLTSLIQCLTRVSHSIVSTSAKNRGMNKEINTKTWNTTKNPKYRINYWLAVGSPGVSACAADCLFVLFWSFKAVFISFGPRSFRIGRKSPHRWRQKGFPVSTFSNNNNNNNNNNNIY